jgi:hypothetical protein
MCSRTNIFVMIDENVLDSNVAATILWLIKMLWAYPTVVTWRIHGYYVTTSNLKLFSNFTASQSICQEQEMMFFFTSNWVSEYSE